jgi:CheY-like chemotaxis protein
MLDQEDLKWVAATATEINSSLQQISRFADLARQHKGDYDYIDQLGQRVDVAAKSAQALFDRITLRILQMSGQMPKGMTSLSGPPEFSVVQPSIKQREQPAAKPSKEGREGSSIPLDIKLLNADGEQELILIVEDETEIAELAGLMLTDEGYRVILAHDGFEALRIYQQISTKIGLVILDFFLPVMDGDAVFDELLALNPNVAVVLSSGLKEQSKLGNMLAKGLRGFIPKPYTREKLSEQVRSTLDMDKATTV